MRLKLLIAFCTIITSYNLSFAKFTNQYFIKISPSDSLVKYGKLYVKKFRTVLEYQTDENKQDLVKPDIALRWINNQLQNVNQEKQSKILFFIHGFWGSSPYAINITSKAFENYYFQNDSSNIDAIVHILWKSNNISYEQAIISLNNSAKTLAHTLNAIQFLQNRRYSIMCHSMGSRLLFETVSNYSITTKFSEMILMAPDLNYTKLNDNALLFYNIASGVYVFFNNNDQILLMSKYLNKNERLGRKPKQKTNKNIKFIDCTKMNDYTFNIDYFTEHLYFLYSKKVRQEVEKILY